MLVHEHGGAGQARELFLALDQVGRAVLLRVRLDLGKAGQALFFEEHGVKGEGRGHTPYRLPGAVG